MSKRFLRGLILSIEYLALIGSIILIVHSIKNSNWEVTAAALAVIAAIIANFNSQRISWKQEDEYEADIEINFDLKTISRKVLLVIENTGGSRAYKVNFTITPELKVIKNEIIKNGNLNFIDKKERIQYNVSDTADMFTQNLNGERPKDYTVEYSFSQTENGRLVKKQKTISMEQYRMTTSPDSDLEDFYIKNSNISDKLDKLEKAILQIRK
ncbi:hypothetical protein [Chryseobacterium balustinum]|uniref:SMODS-associating 2TM beta-strand rich effector domain-containing protein n=2 Tax=Chryseobacterium balustinum TaxID=246 RepID=A0AAX2IR14_9FLAO|nr:hypothetical protein [Chryseobacterium balustinum]SKC12248.1 hypothetical protein SAMN05421800_1394 [Chryseobacterium balustinum]SQA92561.1 Uncharacterised protein [Chryseobacterium balustinum]